MSTRSVPELLENLGARTDDRGIVRDPELHKIIVRAHEDGGMEGDAIVRITFSPPAR